MEISEEVYFFDYFYIFECNGSKNVINVPCCYFIVISRKRFDFAKSQTVPNTHAFRIRNRQIGRLFRQSSVLPEMSKNMPIPVSHLGKRSFSFLGQFFSLHHSKILSIFNNCCCCCCGKVETKLSF